MVTFCNSLHHILSKSLRSLRTSQISGRQRSFRCFIAGRLITPRRPREYFEGVKRDGVAEANGLNLFQLCFTPTRFLSFSPIFHSTKFLTFTTFFFTVFIYLFFCLSGLQLQTLLQHCFSLHNCQIC